MKNILITGGAGFIGSNLALKLITKGYKVKILDNLSIQIHGEVPEKTSPLYNSIKDKVVFIRGSVLSKNDWVKAIEGQDAIIHLAAETGTGQSMYKIKKYIDTNVSGTALMLEALLSKKHQIQKIILASSRAVYGEGKYLCDRHGIVYPQQRQENNLLHGDYECKCPFCNDKITLLPTSEDSIISPTSIYGMSKFSQESILQIMSHVIKVPVVIFRYQNVFGPGQSLTNPYTGILSIFSSLIKCGDTINIFEDGQESRDFVYINDVVKATILGLEMEQANNNIFNVGSGIPYSVIYVAETLIKMYKSNTTLKISGNFRTGDIRHNFADLDLIKNKLGYKPTSTFEYGIQHFVEWVNENNISQNKFQNSINEMKNRGLLK